MKTIQISDYLYSILEEEASRRIEEDWMESATPDKVASESIAFFFGYDIMPSFFDLDSRMDAFRDCTPLDIDKELYESLARVDRENRMFEEMEGVA